MKTLNVAPCPCTPCQARHRQMNGIKQQVGLPSSDQLTSDQVQEDTGVGHVFPGPTQQQIQALNQLTKRPPVPLGQTYSTHQGGGKILAGPDEKKMVAEYARIHGAVAAAKKFGVPPPVSTYYQRKDSNSSEWRGRDGRIEISFRYPPCPRPAGTVNESIQRHEPDEPAKHAHHPHGADQPIRLPRTLIRRRG